MAEKKLFKCEVFSWYLGERIVHRRRYIYAYSMKQASTIALKGQRLREDWSLYVEEVTA